MWSRWAADRKRARAEQVVQTLLATGDDRHRVGEVRELERSQCQFRVSRTILDHQDFLQLRQITGVGWANAWHLCFRRLERKFAQEKDGRGFALSLAVYFAASAVFRGRMDKLSFNRLVTWSSATKSTGLMMWFT